MTKNSNFYTLRSSDFATKTYLYLTYIFQEQVYMLL